jgi:hypothetical protein
MAWQAIAYRTDRSNTNFSSKFLAIKKIEIQRFFIIQKTFWSLELTRFYSIIFCVRYISAVCLCSVPNTKKSTVIGTWYVQENVTSLFLYIAYYQSFYAWNLWNKVPGNCLKNEMIAFYVCFETLQMSQELNCLKICSRRYLIKFIRVVFYQQE